MKSHYVDYHGKLDYENVFGWMKMKLFEANKLLDSFDI